MHHRDIVGEASRDKIDAAFAQVLETGDTARSIDWVLIRKDAARRFVESSISLLKDLKGRPAGFSVFLRDVTERQRSEALRQAKLAAEAASRSKGEFLASMSHEIRTPLNAVIGLVDLMLASDLRPDQREDLDVVRSSAYALLSIINNVLDFSKIEAGRLELDPAAFGLEQFLDESLKIMAMKAHSKGIELACRLAPEVPDRLVGDLTRFRQVLLNLVDNAIKFTARGEVIVSVTRRALTETEVTLQVTVTDTGIGIAPDMQRRIFKAYDQGDPSVSRRYGGTGLGLAVSAQLVRLMGGRIGVKSVPGQGSAFGFTAVFGRPPEAPVPAGPALRPGLDGKTVLVVDDNAAARSISGAILARAGMSVRLAAGAEEALQVLGQTGPAPDFVLLDSDMPGADGFDLAARLRRQVPAARVVMMLTFAHLRRKPECAALGVGATVLKPFGPGELLNALARAAAGVGPAIAAPCGIAGAAGRPVRPGTQRPGGGGHGLQPEIHSAAARALGPRRRPGRRRPQGGGGLLGRPFRHRVHGRADAGDGRPGGGARHPPAGGEPRRPDADHRHDRPRHQGGPRTLPRGRDGRLPAQADRFRKAAADDQPPGAGPRRPGRAGGRRRTRPDRGFPQGVRERLGVFQGSGGGLLRRLPEPSGGPAPCRRGG